ncbi:hypothetical protein MCERE19_01973 [Spirosomataceae bacterium]|jgi:hypothetical protein
MKILKKIEVLIFFEILILTISSCSLKQKEKVFLIPEGYNGEVRIFWNDKKSKNKIFKNNDNYYLFILNGDLTNFRLQDEPTPSGLYDIKYYYYSKDTIYQIASAGHIDSLPDYPYVGGGCSGGINGEKVYGFRVKSSK